MNYSSGGNRGIFLTDLIEPGELQGVQDSFADVAGVSIRVVDTNGKPVTKASNERLLCCGAFQDAAAKEKFCLGCLPEFLGGRGVIDDDFSFECVPGLKNYLVPLKVMLSGTRSFITGYMIIGPVIFMKRRSKEEFELVASGMGLDFNQLWNHVLDLRVFSYQGIRSLLDMITGLTSRVLTLSYEKLVIKENARSSELPDERAAGTASSDEFFGLFLDLIVGAMGGSTGSVMLLDKEKNDLVIKAAHGLPREVVPGVSLKFGDGIAGMAAQTKRPFLINQDKADEIISDRLNRPDLFSSMVVPIKYRDDVFGVVNISSGISTPVRFDEQNLAFVVKAAGLAGVALSHLKN